MHGNFLNKGYNVFFSDMVVFLFGIRLMNVIAENPFFHLYIFIRLLSFYLFIYVVQFQITWDGIPYQTRLDCIEIF